MLERTEQKKADISAAMVGGGLHTMDRMENIKNVSEQVVEIYKRSV